MAYRDAMSAHCPQALQRESDQSCASASRRSPAFTASDLSVSVRQAIRSPGIFATEGAFARTNGAGMMSKTLTNGMSCSPRLKGEQKTSRYSYGQADCLSVSASKNDCSSALASKWAAETPVSVSSRAEISLTCAFIAKAALARRDFGKASMIEDASAVTYTTAASGETGALMAPLIGSRDASFYAPKGADVTALAPRSPVNHVRGEIVAAQRPETGIA